MSEDWYLSFSSIVLCCSLCLQQHSVHSSPQLSVHHQHDVPHWSRKTLDLQKYDQETKCAEKLPSLLVSIGKLGYYVLKMDFVIGNLWKFTICNINCSMTSCKVWQIKPQKKNTLYKGHGQLMDQGHPCVTAGNIDTRRSILPCKSIERNSV